MDEQSRCLNGNNLKNYNNTRLNLTFENLCYKVTCKKEKRIKNILTNVSGHFNSGRLIGILGPSGAGKTSLLNILAGFKKTGASGNIMVNGKRRDLDEFRWQSCCISQETAMLPLLTAHETMMTAANLKLPVKLPIHQKQKIISDIADILNIQKIMNTRVSNISGGELKRLSIAVELITNPPIMFFDEPTSGLDSVSSCQVVSHLQSLALGGRTIVCVIHQPSSKIFDMFDDLFLLANGRVIYGGPIRDMIPVFESSGFHCRQYYNRADFALEVASLEIEGDIDTLAAKSITRSQDFYSSTSNTIEEISSGAVSITRDGSTPSDYRGRIAEEEEQLATSISIEDVSISCRKTFAVSQWRQFLILLKRSTICTFRDMHLASLRVIVHGLVGMTLGLIYYQIGDEASKITTNTAYLFFILMFIFFANSMPTILSFPVEASVFQREHLNNWYSLPAYFFSKILADLPLQLTCPTFFLLVGYFMTGQPNDCHRIGLIWIVCVVFTIISQLCGLVSGVAFNVKLALFALPAMTIPMLIFSGFFIRFEEVPFYLKFMTHISYFGYAFHAIVQSIYGYDRPDLHCSRDFCVYKKPTKYLEDIDMLKGTFAVDISALIGYMVFLQIALFCSLKYRIWKSQ